MFLSPAVSFGQNDTTKAKTNVAQESNPGRRPNVHIAGVHNKSRMIRIVHKEHDAEVKNYADIICNFLKPNDYMLKCGSKSFYPDNFFIVALDTVGYTVHVSGNK
jgi:hypothetical protein